MDEIARENRDGERALKPMEAAVRRTLIESHRDMLRFLQRRLRNQEEAEEVFQRFILKAIEKAGDLRDIRSVRAWLGRVLATTIIDFQRAAIRRRNHEHAVDPAQLADMADFTIEPDVELDQAVCDCLYQLLPTLKPEYAEVIWRVDLLGEPRDRIAVSLGTTVNNISVRLHRARKSLRIRLEQMCDMCAVHGFLNCSCKKAEQSRVSRVPKRRTKFEGPDAPQPSANDGTVSASKLKGNQ